MTETAQDSSTTAGEGDLAWHAEDPEAIAQSLDTTDDGLDEAEVERRLREHGPNTLAEDSGPSKLTIVLNQFRSPLITILLVAGVVAGLLGEHIDAGFIAAVLLINAAIGYVQEYKAESSIQSLMELAAPTSTVLRGGDEQEVDSAELVPGDVVVLQPGDRVPADIRLSEVSRLEIDESLLTGESTTVHKAVEPVKENAPVAERSSMVYMGATVSGGGAKGYVVATGMGTELGQIAESVQSEEQPDTPLQQRMERFARLVAVAVAVASGIIVVWGLLRGMELTEVFLLAVALAVSAVPEGLPVAFTVALALGVQRMADRQAIVRRLPAVETLGSTTTIGSDKTGTLTRNEMTVEAVWAGGTTYDLDEEGLRDEDGDAVDVEGSDARHLVLLAGILTNAAQLGDAGEEGQDEGDPTEVALLHSALHAGLDLSALREEHEVVVDRPFDPAELYSAAVCRDGDGYLLVAKGATERLLDRCSALQGADGQEELDAAAVQDAMEAMAEQGLRVLGMAAKRLDEAPDDAEDIELTDMVFCGLQGMMDPPREHVSEAIAGCQEAGIRVVMITGDHAKTARAIAGELGIGGDDCQVLTGPEAEELSDTELTERVCDVGVYARVSPEHKLRVIHALQERGEVAAVTGDGINDAPALKAAEIGIAMGDSGTDVAREAADMVLTDDDFVSIRDAVEEGRVTFDNVRKVTFFLVATGAAEVLIILFGFGAGWVLPLLPAQILWLNLVTNGFQDVALAFEPDEPGVLQRPPRQLEEGLLSRLLWERTAIVAVVMAAATLWLFWQTLQETGSETQARSVALTTLVVLSAVQVYMSRSEHESVFRLNPLSNRFLLVAQVGALAIHAVALHLPFTQLVLRVEPVNGGALLWMAALSLVVLAVNEAHKALRTPPGGR
jgi:magnesium-transporting ATPase (P-type)